MVKRSNGCCFRNADFEKNRFATGCFLAFLIISFLSLFFHEPWRDELQCWAIAKESTSFFDMLHKARYEGHPSAWYAILYFITRFSGAFIFVRVCHLLLAAVVAYLILFRSPFSNLHKCLAVFGYFFIYEYAALSRNYAIGILLLLLVCVLLKNKNKYWLHICGLLFLALQANVFAMILSCALFVSIFFRHFLFFINKNTSRLNDGPSETPLNIGVFVTGGLFFLIGFLISVFDMLPPVGSTFAPEWVWGSPQWKHALSAFFHAMAPLPKWEMHFWNNHIFQYYFDGQYLAIVENVLAGILLVACIYQFRKDRIALIFFSLAWLGIAVFLSVKYTGFMRHHGHYFVAYFMALWVKKGGQGEVPGKSFFFTAVLSLHVLGAATAIFFDAKHPFSQSQEVAKYIGENYPPQQRIVGHYDYAASPVAFRLGRPIFYPNQNKEGTFLYWDTQRYEKEITDIAKNLDAICQEGGPFLLLLCYPLSEKQLANDHLKLIKIFVPAIVNDEAYWLYDVTCH